MRVIFVLQAIEKEKLFANLNFVENSKIDNYISQLILSGTFIKIFGKF